MKVTYLSMFSFILLLSILFISNIMSAKTIYVNVNYNGKVTNGKLWNTPYNNLQNAIKKAKDGDSIWVTKGTYYTTESTDRSISFKLKKGISLYGGFSGNETKLAQRNIDKNATILSGNIGDKTTDKDNSYHVVVGADNSRLDGFTIKDGYAIPQSGKNSKARLHVSPELILNGPNNSNGAGLVNFKAATAVYNCIFENNKASKGGGVYNMTSSSFNATTTDKSKIPVFVNCVFKDNYALERGGGVSNDLGTSPVFMNCVFSDNRTPAKGGGMYNDFGCSPILINCLFNNNYAARSAAGMGNDGGSSPVLYYCTFTANHSVYMGPSLYQGSGSANDPVLINNIVWNNKCDWGSNGIYSWHLDTPIISNSNIEGGYLGKDNFSQNPKFDKNFISKSDCGFKGKSSVFNSSKLTHFINMLGKYQKFTGRAKIVQYIPKNREHSDRIVYVNVNNKGLHNGKSWNRAYASLQKALVDASKDGAVVWIAQGIYKPSVKNRNISFNLSSGVRIYGGFVGDETKLSQRNPEKYHTVLSGNIGNLKIANDNSYHVLITANNTVVNGVTIQDAYGDGTGYNSQGAVINYHLISQQGQGKEAGVNYATGFSVNFKNCIIKNNYAKVGGAVYSYDHAKTVYENCSFINNKADDGGAVVDRVGVKSNFDSCRFINNTANYYGGAVYVDYGSNAQFEKCIFRGNHSLNSFGGAIFSMSRAAQVGKSRVNANGCLFKLNTVKGDGGAIACFDLSIGKITNCKFSKNKAENKGNAISVTEQSDVTLANNLYNGNRTGRNSSTYKDKSSTLKLLE
ncbi:MAG: hypothetical protein GY756_00890 [bacterium]|nr:hypothetical protein [bacterium]